ncbi:MAG: ATP-dependent helicase HrpB [Verrucomicrobiota bacterium]
MELPILQQRGAILEALRTHHRLVLEAPTGSGKSTQVPGMMLDGGVVGDGDIWVLQPRRVAARMLARRVAAERGGPVGGEVGFQVRLESAVGQDTRIRYVTEGVLLRRLTVDPKLEGTGAVVLDEFHERHLEADLTLARLAALQNSDRPDLKLVVMSATLEAGALLDYLAPAAHVRAEGRTFPVEIDYLPRRYADDRVWDVAAEAMGRLDPAKVEGDVLVFMPGAFEIRKTLEVLRGTLLARGRALLPLHGELPPREQDAAVLPGDQPRLIVSTNLAETSVTIDGVTLVVDGGLARVAGYDPRRGINTLLTEKISRASADQRAGRAGRTRPGRCLRLWTQEDHARRPEQLAAEVHRLDLSEAVLALKAAGFTDLAAFAWFEAPGPESLQRAEDLLGDLGALDEAGAITETGRAMLAFPLHPRYARLMLEAGQRQCVPSAALLAALAQGRPLFRRRGRGDRRQAELQDDLFGGETRSDFFRLMRAWNWAKARGFDPRAAGKLGLNAAAAREAGAIAAQIARSAERAGLESPENAPPADEADLRRCILAGFSDHLARRLDGGTLRCDLIHGRRATLARESAVRDAPLLVAAEIREVEQRGGEEVDTLLSLATEVEEAWLRELNPHAWHEGETTTFDPHLKRVVAVRERRFRDLVLARETRGEPDPDAAGALLAKMIEAGEIPLRTWDEAVEAWLRRVAFLRAAQPELELPEFHAEDRRGVLEVLTHGEVTAKAVRDKPVLPVLRDWLRPEQRQALDRLAPERVTLPGGRQARVTYPDGGEPYLASRLQDFFGQRESPRILGGTHPLLLHLLAPNQRPLQMTKDLASFWANAYPEIRSELKIRYPKHDWPENPLTAQPPAARKRGK